MKTVKTDHRVRLTKQIIKDSLVSLMQEYPVSKLSVKMLCETAGINRSTFYAHYSDVYDLLNQIQEEIIRQISEYISERAFSEQTQLTVLSVRHILEYARDNSRLLKVLLSENGDYTFQKNIMLLAQDKIIHELRNMRHIDKCMSEYLQIFAVTGALSVIRKWLQNDMPESTEEMADLCTKLLYKGLSGFDIK